MTSTLTDEMISNWVPMTFLDQPLLVHPNIQHEVQRALIRAAMEDIIQIRKAHSQWNKIGSVYPPKGVDIWLYDSMFGSIIATTVTTANHASIFDADFTHWMMRNNTQKPEPPPDGLVHAVISCKQKD